VTDQIGNGAFVADAAVSGEGDDEVEHRQGIAQAAVCLSGNQLQGFLFCLYLLFAGNTGQVAAEIFDLYAVEVEDLTAG
jgi:hypothetical protein